MRIFRLDYRECNITPKHTRYYFSVFLLLRKVLKLLNLRYDDVYIKTICGHLPIDEIYVWAYRCDSENRTVFYLTKWGAHLFAKELDEYDNPLDFTISEVPLSLLLEHIE